MIGYETTILGMTILNCLSANEKEIERIRKTLREQYKFEFDIYKVFEGMINGIELIVQERYREKRNFNILNQNITVDDLLQYLKKVGITVEKEDVDILIKLKSKTNNNILTICDLFKFLIGEDFEEQMLNFSLIKIPYCSLGITSEIEYLVNTIFEKEIEFIKQIKFLVKQITKKSDFSLNAFYELLCKGDDNFSITYNSLKHFYTNIIKINYISEGDISLLLKVLDFDNDNIITFSDLKRIFEININTEQLNINNNVKKEDKFISIERIEKQFLCYVNDLLKYEHKIEIEKENFISSHSEFSIHKLFNYLLISKLSTSISFKSLFLSFTKLNIYLTEKEMNLLTKRIDHFNQTNTTYDKLYMLIMPMKQIEIKNINPEEEILPNILLYLKTLIQTMIIVEKQINMLKKNFSYIFTAQNLSTLFNYINKDNVNNPFLSYSNFCHYLKKKGILNSSISPLDIS